MKVKRLMFKSRLKGTATWEVHASNVGFFVVFLIYLRTLKTRPKIIYVNFWFAFLAPKLNF